MIKHKSIWLFYSLIVATFLVVLLASIWLMSQRFNDFFLEHSRNVLQQKAQVVSSYLIPPLQPKIPSSLDDKNIAYNQACHALAISDEGIRVTLIDQQGLVLCDSVTHTKTMDNHKQREEVQQALKTGYGSSIRYSQTLDKSMLYMAILAQSTQHQPIIVRTAYATSATDKILEGLYQQTLALVGLMTLIVIGIAMVIYYKIQPGFEMIVQAIEHFARGHFKADIPSYGIREIDHLGQSLNRMANRAERLDRLRQEFVGNVSHELRTPIATIKGYLETLDDGAMHDPQDRKRFIGIALKQSDRMALLVDDLLTLSRLESAPLSEILHLSQHTAYELLIAAKDATLMRAEEKHININLQGDQQIPIHVDHSLVVQALINLIDNAIKYSEADTNITLSVEQKDNNTILSVADEGSGIPEEHLERIFERFYRVDKARARRQGGTGLGLAIVKHIMQIHDARVEAKVRQPNGTLFCLIFQSANH